MITVEVGDSDVHKYASGISAGEVIANVHGRKSGAVAALVDGIAVSYTHLTLPTNTVV